MLEYIRNVVPRIQQYSQTLDRKELLIDQPWVLIDTDGNKHQYIFERDGNLIMSYNGDVQYGKWKYIPAAQSLVIDRTNGSLLFNHWFVSKGACILKKDGFNAEPWALVNSREVPDLDLKRYLYSLLPEFRSYKLLPVEEGTVFYNHEEYTRTGTVRGTDVKNYTGSTINSTLKSKDHDIYYRIENNRVTKVFVYETLTTDRGTLTVEKNANSIVTKGDSTVSESGEPANGRYKVLDHPELKRLDVVNGVVRGISSVGQVSIIYALVTILVLATIFGIAIHM